MDYIEYPNGDQVYNVTVAYMTREIKGEVQIDPREVQEYQFFEMRALPEPISPPVKVVISQFMERSIF